MQCAFDAENWESCVAVVILKVHLISIERLSLGSNRILFFSFSLPELIPATRYEVTPDVFSVHQAHNAGEEIRLGQHKEERKL